MNLATHSSEVSTAAVTALLDEVSTEQAETIIRDYVQEAKDGGAKAVYQRDQLLRDLVALLSLSGNRHVILVGEEGVGKRTLVYSLAQLLAEGKGPADLEPVIDNWNQYLDSQKNDTYAAWTLTR